MIGGILKKVALKLLTEKFIIKLTMLGLGHLVKKTDNTLDDELFKAVEEALK